MYEEYILFGKDIIMTLNNKLGITDSSELAKAEEKISKKKAVEMFETGYLNNLKAGTYDALAEIHKYIFGEIYDFAGKMRDVNIAKNNFRFVPAMYLKNALEQIEKMPQSNFDEIIEKYVEMNVAHPFREGNGRSPIRDIEIKHILKQALTDKVNDRELYMKGIDYSYYYEGYTAYKSEEQ